MARRQIVRILLVVGILFTAYGCGGMSGVGGHSSYSCPTPDGTSCASLSDVYYASRAHQLPSQNAPSSLGTGVAAATATAQGSAQGLSPQHRESPTSGAPVLNQPYVLRVWFAPWEDIHGILHDQQYVYLNVGNATWNVDHIKEQLNEYRPGGNRIYLPSSDQQQQQSATGKDGAPQPKGTVKSQGNPPKGGNVIQPSMSSDKQGKTLMMESSKPAADK